MDQLKEDMRLLHAMGIRFLRTYNVQLPHASNVVKAIAELKESDPAFEMYVMLGAWIDCEGAWTNAPNHAEQDFEANEAEISPRSMLWMRICQNLSRRRQSRFCNFGKFSS